MPRFLMLSLKYILLLSCLVPAAAATTPANDLGGLLSHIQTLQADFTQQVYDHKHKLLEQAYGKMALQRPGRFRWQVVKPIPQLIIVNQTRLWIYDPDLQQVTIRPLQKAAGTTPAFLLTDEAANLDKNFIVTRPSSKVVGEKWFKLQPKEKGSMFSLMQINFRKGQIQSMQLKDNLGHTTTIQWQNIQTNLPVSAALFTFNTPPKVDVIDETRSKN